MKKRNLFALVAGVGLFFLSLTACEFTIGGGDNPSASHGGNSQSGDTSSIIDPGTSSNDNPAGSSSSSTVIVTNELSSIEVTHLPNKVSYQLNEAADYTGLEVTAHFTVNADKVIPQTELRITGFDSSSLGNKTINISYTFEKVTKSTSFDIAVMGSSNVTLDVYGFNDVHGNVMDTTLGVGIAKTTTFMKNKTEGQNSLLISSGDMWQGSLESNSNRGVLMTKWMQQLNFTSMTIGNHEFDWGTQVIKNNSANYDLPILGINIIDKTTNKRADYVSPSTVVSRGGAKIGIIGAVGNCYSSISYSQVMDVEFILDKEGYTRQPLTELIKAESTRLRQEEGCDFIIYSFHGDSIRDDTYYNPELSTGHYVDMVFEGHKHLETHYQDVGGVWHFQSAADNCIDITHAKIELNLQSDSYTVSFNESKDIYHMNTDDKRALAEDAGTLALINEYDFAPYYVSLGTNTAVRYGNYLRQLCADLYLEKALEKWPTYANQITLGGGYISVRGDGQLPVGEVTYAKLYNLFPFDNDILLMQVNGAVLKGNFINSTNSNYFLAYTSYGGGLRDDQATISDTNQYYVISDTYTFDYLLKWNNNPIKVASYSDEGYYARDCLADYAKAGRFNTGEIIPVVSHQGTITDPYSISDALSLAGDTSVWGYFKGKVSSDSFFLSTNYFQNVVLEDTENSEKTMNVYKLHRHDNDTVSKSDSTPIHGFKNKSELPVGTEVVYYGNVKAYDSGPGSGSTCFAVTIDGRPASGLTAETPASVVSLWQAFSLNMADGLYVFGKVQSVTKEGGNITDIVVAGEHTLDYGTSHVDNYSLAIHFIAPFTCTYASGLSADNINEDAEIVFRVIGDEIQFVSVVEHSLPESTADNPYSVTQALQVAAKYTAQGDAPRIYCTGVVSRQGYRVGSSGDIGSVYIKDPTNNNEILIYWLRKYQAAPPDNNFSSIDDVKVGDVLVINGQAFNYNGTTLEFGSGTYCLSINGVATHA